MAKIHYSMQLPTGEVWELSAMSLAHAMERFGKLIREDLGLTSGDSITITVSIAACDLPSCYVCGTKDRPYL